MGIPPEILYTGSNRSEHGAIPADLKTPFSTNQWFSIGAYLIEYSFSAFAILLKKYAEFWRYVFLQAHFFLNNALSVSRTECIFRRLHMYSPAALLVENVRWKYFVSPCTSPAAPKTNRMEATGAECMCCITLQSMRARIIEWLISCAKMSKSVNVFSFSIWYRFNII